MYPYWKNEHLSINSSLQWVQIFHVTPTVCVPSIERIGIDPLFSNGATKVSWWCEKKCLLWAISHISALKSISVDQLSVCAGRYWAGGLKKTNLQGVFTCGFVTIPNRVYRAMDIFNWFTPEGEFING
jgi:hypothetical protein